MQYDVVIIGGGPAGIASAIYCKRANLNVIILDSYVIGGNPNNYLEIENYPGMGKISTSSLIDNFTAHLQELDIPYAEFCNVKTIDTTTNTVIVEDSVYKEEIYNYKHLIIATGSRPRMLGVQGEEEHIGKGVHYCAICDGPLYKDKIVAVIGGGNSACEEALGLAKICKEVYIIEYSDKLNAEQITVDKVYNTKNISVYTGYSVTGIEDEEFDGVQYMSLFVAPRENLEKHEGVVEYSTRPELKLWVSGIFPYIGMVPNIPNIISGSYDVELPTDKAGFLCVDENMHLFDNVYAVGDVTSKKYRQVVTAIADGAIAAIAISKED